MLAKKYYDEAVAVHLKYKYDSSNFFMKKAIHIYEEQNFWNRAIKLHNFYAWNLVLLNEFSHAEKYLFFNLKKGKEKLGEEHYLTSLNFNTLGLVNWYLGELDSALYYFNKSLNLRIKLLGKDDPKVGENYNNMAMVYDDKGDLEKALLYYDIANKNWISNFGLKNTYVAQNLNNIGVALDGSGDYGRSIDYYKKAAVIWSNLYGSSYLELSQPYMNMGATYLSLNEPDSALDWLNNALIILGDNFDFEDYQFAMCYSDMANAYALKAKNFINNNTLFETNIKKAISYYQKAITIKQKYFGTNHYSTADSYLSMGDLYINNINADSAKYCLVKAYHGYESVFGRNHYKIADVYSSYVKLYVKVLNKLDSALVYSEKAMQSLCDSESSLIYFKPQNCALSLTEKLYMFRILSLRGVIFFRKWEKEYYTR